MDDAASSASIGVAPNCLVLLLLELSLESNIPPRLPDKGLAAKKGGIGVVPKVNWAVSSMSESRMFVCL